MGTFGRPCFAFVKTQIVGKTKFFDSLRHAYGVRNLLPHFAFGKTGRTGAPQSAA